jgi:hypothetical protein
MHIQILKNNLPPQDISGMTGLEVTARRRELRISLCSAVGRIAYAVSRNRNPEPDVASFEFWLGELLAFQIAIGTNPPANQVIAR